VQIQVGSTQSGEKFNQIKDLQALSDAKSKTKVVQKQGHANCIESIF
jgi:hypothetical protein